MRFLSLLFHSSSLLSKARTLSHKLPPLGISELVIPQYTEALKQYLPSQPPSETAAAAPPSIPFSAHAPLSDSQSPPITHLVAHSSLPVVSSSACRDVIDECEARATKMGGWTTARHANFATTDVPLAELPKALAWFKDSVLPDVAYPFMDGAFSPVLPPGAAKNLRVVDAFVVKYNATAVSVVT